MTRPGYLAWDIRFQGGEQSFVPGDVEGVESAPVIEGEHLETVHFLQPGRGFDIRSLMVDGIKRLQCAAQVLDMYF